jgi:phosphatidylglycerol:prolipoprotein diacylglycerol transferase
MLTAAGSPIVEHRYWVDRLNSWLVHFGGGFGIRWYGLAYLAGFLLAGWILSRWARKGRLPICEEEVATFTLLAALGVMIGGRLGYCLFDNLHEAMQRPLEVFALWHGGMASRDSLRRRSLSPME